MSPSALQVIQVDELSPRFFRRRTIRGKFQEMFVDRRIGGKFRVKGSGEDVALFYQCGFPFKFSQNTDAGCNLFDDRAANEHHLQRIFLERRGTEENIAGKLAAVAIAQNGHVQKFEGILPGIFHMCGQKNRSGAGAKYGSAFAGEFPNGVVKTLFLEELQLCGAFSARQDETVTTFQVGYGAHFKGVHAEFVKHFGVGLKITLDR
jgi:hypothetical protein